MAMPAAVAVPANVAANVPVAQADMAVAQADMAMPQPDMAMAQADMAVTNTNVPMAIPADVDAHAWLEV